MTQGNTNKKSNADFKSLRFKLTLGFVLFALVLMGLLWILQTVFLNKYYERSMDRKVSAALNTVSELFAGEENLNIPDFSKLIERYSRQDDIFFYMEDTDGQHGMSSVDLAKIGRSFYSTAEIVGIARGNLESSGGKEVSFVMNTAEDARLVVRALRVDSAYRNSIYLYAIAAVTPLGPTVTILQTLLFFITMIALIAGAVIAAFYSRRFSRPISAISEKAKELAKGDYSVDFDTSEGFTEIRELAGTLNETAEELGRADALQKDLLANVSHDLRTPLTMIKSYAEMIRDISGDNPAKREEHLGVIVEEADRLSDLVGDILLISKMQSGTLELEHKRFDLQRAAENVIAPFMVLEQEGYKFSLTTIPAAVSVVGDESKLQQVISNLISNAVRYSREQEPVVMIGFNRVGESRVRVSVSDNGVGIPEDQLEGIWNRYQRASRSAGRALSGGTGLGLSIVREILEHHGASYGVSSHPGEGSTFWFEMDCEFL